MPLIGPTDETAALIHQLHPDIHIWQIWRKIAFRASDPAGVIRAIREKGETGAIPRLLGLMLAKERDVANAAVSAVEDLFSLVQQQDLPQLDERVRHVSGYLSPSGAWDSLEPSKTGLLTQRGDPVIMLGLATMHPSGYLRQSALLHLDQISDERVLPFLLLRLNDWVIQVRETAREAAERRLAPDCAPSWIRYLPLLIRLSEHRRSSHRAFLEQVLGLLKDPACLPALREGLKSPERLVRRTCYSLLLEAPTHDSRNILEQALCEKDPIVRTRAAERLSTLMEPDQFHAWLPRLERDTWVPIRRIAIELHTEHWSEEATGVLRHALFDDASGIRDLARRCLMKEGVEDFRDIYRTAITTATSARVLYTAIVGLGETGALEDGVAVLPLLEHEVPKIRRAAVQTLSRLGGDRYTPELLRKIADDNPRVSRAALEALERHARRLDPQETWDIFGQTRFFHVRRNVLALLQDMGRWQGIPFLVRASAHPDSATSDRAASEIERWVTRLNSGYVKPTALQIEDLTSALDDSGCDIRGLRSIVEYWSNRPGMGSG